MDAYGVVLLPVVFALLRVSKPSRYFELGVQLRERTAGEAEKLQQLTSRISSCALRNIGRDRDGGAPHLGGEAVDVLTREMFGVRRDD
jgi:hypothetical protein